MKYIEAFRILEIDKTKDERAIKNAYRNKLTVTNPEDNPEGFKELRSAYEEACRYAKQEDDAPEEERPRDTTPSGLWVERAEGIYKNIHTRQDIEAWKELFNDDIFMSLEEEENCRIKLIGFLMDNFRLPTEVWKLLDKKLAITSDTKSLREVFPPHFLRFCIGRCERGEDVEFGQFVGAEDANYDLFLHYYDRCWQALQDKNLEDAQKNLDSADELGIWHPVMEVCRANLLLNKGQTQEAIALMEDLYAKYPQDAMICYNTAEMFWAQGDGDKRAQAADIYKKLKEENDSHYMANVRLTEWYCDQKRYRDAKNCAEKVLAAGGDDYFMEVLCRVNVELEKDLEAKYRENGGWEPALELCWCYLQDGKISQGIQLAMKIKELLPPEKELEHHGLLAKLYVEQAEYEKAVDKSHYWEEALKKRLETPESEEIRDRDRLRQAHLIRMQCYRYLGYQDKENFKLAIKEGESILVGGTKDIGLLMEIAQMYMELEEYERSLEISQNLVDEYQIFAAYASMLEVHRRQLNARGVVQAASQCMRYFPGFAKAYEYLAKVYLDLNYHEDLQKVLEDAEKNEVKSVILDAYKFQIDHKPMDTSIFNRKLKKFREHFLKAAEEGEKDAYEKGLPLLTEYLYNYPDDFMLVERAIFHRAAHHYDEAREDFEKALYINPSNPYALNGLSFVYKYLGDYEKALFYIKKAILYMDTEMSPIIYADMGNLYSLLGIYESAYEAYTKYESIIGRSKSLWFGDNMAECCLRTGRIEEAEEIYARFYAKDKWKYYEKLIDLYIATGQEEKARKVLGQWGNELHLNSVGYAARTVKRYLNPNVKPTPEESSYPAYYSSKGWIELVFGSKTAAVNSFGRMVGCCAGESNFEGKLCDAIFACIICGDYKRGRKYGRQLAEWMKKEQFSGKNSYFNREKGYLQKEFLSVYYTEDAEALQKILEREEKCEICHFCTIPLCKELESVRILLLYRMGRQKEAWERLCRNLEVQPWDEFMLAIRHILFQDAGQNAPQL